MSKIVSYTPIRSFFLARFHIFIVGLVSSGFSNYKSYRSLNFHVFILVPQFSCLLSISRFSMVSKQFLIAVTLKNKRFNEMMNITDVHLTLRMVCTQNGKKIPHDNEKKSSAFYAFLL